MRLTLLALLLLPPVAAAQVERYELGRRLKRFEAEWEKVPDPAARKRALAIIPKASTQFLTLNLTEAARTVDDAYWALKAAEPPAAGVRWLDALCVVPEKRVLGVDEPIKVEVRQLYAAGERPPGAKVRVGLRETPEARFEHFNYARREAPLDPLPARLELPPELAKFAPGEWSLVLSAAFYGGPEPATGHVELALFRDLTARLTALRAAADACSKRVEAATARGTADLLVRTARGEVPETDLPLVSLLRQAEAGVSAPGKGPFGGHGFPPEPNWLVMPTGKTETACRLFVPPGPTKPVPAVVALHGMGGSENMFFESYGAGHIVKECQKRGWLLLAPRCGFFGPPPVADLLDTLAQRYPIDRKRVYLVGHSMGAGQVIDLAQKHPGAFAGVAVLGGGGRLRQKDALRDTPVFVGMGTADFALVSGKALVKNLAAAGATKVTAKEYPDLDHLLIVREALPDVFKLFDGLTP